MRRRSSSSEPTRIQCPDEGVAITSGAVSAGQGVTITYAVTVANGVAAGALIANTVQLDDGAGQLLTRSATVIVAGERLHLPYASR